MEQPELKFLINRTPIILSSLFVGAASYCAFSESPARQRLDEENCLKQWADSFRNAYKIMASISVLGTVAGFVNYSYNKNLYYGLGGAAMLSLLPYTFATLTPLYTVLLTANDKNQPSGTRATIEKWVKRHYVRVAIGVVATGLFLLAEFKQKIYSK